jgi:hypothetical protein
VCYMTFPCFSGCANNFAQSSGATRIAMFPAADKSRVRAVRLDAITSHRMFLQSRMTDSPTNTSR